MQYPETIKLGRVGEDLQVPGAAPKGIPGGGFGEGGALYVVAILHHQWVGLLILAPVRLLRQLLISSEVCELKDC